MKPTPIHPGEVLLEDLLKPMGITTQRRLIEIFRKYFGDFQSSAMGRLVIRLS